MNQNSQNSQNSNNQTPKYTISEHIHHIRNTLLACILVIFICVTVGFYVCDYVINTVTAPVISKPMIMLSVFDGVIIKLKVSLLVGFVIALPIVLSMIYLYLRNALLKSEQRIALVSCVWLCISVYVGIFIGYKFLLPVILDYSLQFKIPNAKFEISAVSYLNTSIFACVSTILFMQIPAVILILYKLYGYEFVIKLRKLFILLSFIMGALITPPDPLSQIIFASVCIMMFEATALGIRISIR